MLIGGSFDDPTPSSERVRSASAKQVRAGSAPHHAPGRDDHGLIGEPPDCGEVLFHQEYGYGLRGPPQRLHDLAHDLRRQTLRRLVDQEQPIRVEQHPGQRQHLLLTAGLRVPARCRARCFSSGNSWYDGLVVRRRGALGEPQVLGDRQAAEDAAILRHISDAVGDECVSRPAQDRVAVHLDPAGRRDFADHGAQRGGLADAVAAQHRGDAGARHLEGHALQDVRAVDVDPEVGDGEQRRVCRVHSASPR